MPIGESVSGSSITWPFSPSWSAPWLRATSIDRLSRITVTFTWPGYSSWSSISRAISCERSAAWSSSTLARADDDADLAARLERVHLVDSRLRRRSVLERLEPLDVVLEALAARARPRGGDRIGGDHEHRFDRLRLHLVVVRLDRVHDVLGLPVAARELRGDSSMRALDLVRHRLAEIVQHAARFAVFTLAPSSVAMIPARWTTSSVCFEHVLAVARAEAKPAEDLHELLVERTAVRLEDGLLAGLPDDLLELRLRLVVRLLDAGRMDAAVLDQLRQRQARDLAAEPVERREHDRVRRVVDDEVDAGEVLERADVATLPADDPALHVVGRQLDDGDSRLSRVARRDALERVGDEVARAPLRLRARLLLEHAHAPREVVPDELLSTLEQVRLRLLKRHPGDPLELPLLRGLHLLQLFLELAEVRLAVGEPLVFAPELERAFPRSPPLSRARAPRS